MSKPYMEVAEEFKTLRAKSRELRQTALNLQLAVRKTRIEVGALIQGMRQRWRHAKALTKDILPSPDEH